MLLRILVAVAFVLPVIEEAQMAMSAWFPN